MWGEIDLVIHSSPFLGCVLIDRMTSLKYRQSEQVRTYVETKAGEITFSKLAVLVVIRGAFLAGNWTFRV
jgi:hypothetical protein